MNDKNNILAALDKINVADLSYQEWINVGMGLQSEGFDCSLWDGWSKSDPRYKKGECDRKWSTFRGSGTPITGATICQMAIERGWEPRGNMVMEWDDEIQYDGDDFTQYTAPVEWNPVEDFRIYLETLFEPEDRVGLVTNDVWQDSEGKGDAMMGKQIVVDGRQKRNKGGIYGKQYYIENTHEPIVSREIWQQAQEAIESRNPKKGMPTEIPVYPFTGLIYCAKCGTHYRHKINSSGMKWAKPIWTCGRRLTHNKAACDNPSIKDSVLREKFVECYNEFITERPLGTTAAELQNTIDKLLRDERDLAALARQHLIPDDTFREEQKRIKEQIRGLMDRIAEIRNKGVNVSDFTAIAGFDEEKVKKFITKVMVSDNTVTFVFYNGVEYTRTYTNGQPGNKPGWNKKEEA